jgi:7-carboxy-7-deazaguanine synthase
VNPRAKAPLPLLPRDAQAAGDQAAAPLSDAPIAETFYSIQGEGRLTGTPSFFVRFSGCKLRCTWCDTPYASWNPEGERRTLESILAEALAIPARHAVLTGGEPMIFPQVEPLATMFAAAGLHVTIETAGTVFRALHCDLMSISPKLANSTPGPEHGPWSARHEERRLNFPVLQQLLDGYPSRQLKFVVASQADVDEVQGVLDRLSGWQPDEVMLMPEGVLPVAGPNRDWIVRACLDRGWRYCQRLHIDLFGNTRGT